MMTTPPLHRPLLALRLWMWPAACGLTAMAWAALTAGPPTVADSLLRAGDGRYQLRDYADARLYYLQSFRARPDSDSAARLLLTHLRLERADGSESDSIRQALALRQEGSFSYHYIALFASYRLGRPDSARTHEQVLEQKSRTSPGGAERYWFRMLQGSRLIQEGRWAEAEQRFDDLSSQPGEVGTVATSIRRALQDRPLRPKKDPWTAAGLSALLPGAGQFYARHYSDGVMAFFWNATFLGGGAYTYRLEQQAGRPHSVSVLAILVGLLFYSANITGAYAAAHQFNAYQERAFFQEVRDTYFNIDRMERTSGIEFTRPLQLD